jgi:uncharacterized phage infection (PIP) family protein YhgE
VTSQKNVEELQQLEQKVATLNARAEEEESIFNELREQIHELSAKLVLTNRELADSEALLAEKRTEYAAAEHDDALQAREETAARLAEAVSHVLAELHVYDRAQQAVAAFQDDSDARDAQAEPEIAAELWERLVNAVQQRTNNRLEAELVEAGSRNLNPSASQELLMHLRKAARERT